MSNYSLGWLAGLVAFGTFREHLKYFGNKGYFESLLKYSLKLHGINIYAGHPNLEISIYVLKSALGHCKLKSNVEKQILTELIQLRPIENIQRLKI